MEYRGYRIEYYPWNHSYRLYANRYSKKHIFEGDDIKECIEEVNIIEGIGDNKKEDAE